MSPTAYISAFLPPRVNAGDVRVLCNAGKFTLEGSCDLMRELAAAILSVVPGKQITSVVIPPRTPRKRPVRITEKTEKYLAVMRDLDAEPQTTLARICIRHGVQSSGFCVWRKRREVAAAEQSALAKSQEASA